ncbi:MAG TPA: radical SAM/SPASM domain-containing protein [Rhizomicrobium sp.]
MKIFDLELSSPCNASCDFCPQNWHGVKRQRPFMDEALLDKITREIGAMARTETVHAVLCGMGENLLRKPLVFRALDNLERNSAGAVMTALVTNGSKLTADLLEYESFRRLGAIQVSITGYDRESYERLYGLKHDRIVQNITTMAQAMPGKLHIRSVEFGEPGEDAARTAFVKFWRDRGVPVTTRPLHSRGGHLADPRAYRGQFRQFKGCGIFNYIGFISSDGKVLSCCHDVLSENVVGDCRDETLQEIIARKKQLQAGAFEGYKICAGCTDFELSSPGLFEPRAEKEHVQ